MREIAPSALPAALRAFVGAKAGTNEFGVYWNTARLREAYALAEAAVEADLPEPWWVHHPDHMRGWEAFGVTAASPPTVRQLGTGYDGKCKPGAERWGTGEVRLGVAGVMFSSHADCPSGAYIYVVGTEREDVLRRWRLADELWAEMGARLWPTSR